MRLREAASRLRSLFWYTPGLVLITTGYGIWSGWISRHDPDGCRQHLVAQRWARQLLRLAQVRVDIRGLENLPPGPAVFVANHLSYTDTPVIFASLPVQFRILALRGLFRIPLLGGHLRRARHLPVEQSSARASMHSLLGAAERVRQGVSVFIFPEAHRSPDGQLKPFVAGAFLLALRAQVPIVPMALIGTHELLPPGSWHIRPGSVRFVIGSPIMTQGRSPSEASQLSSHVRLRIIEMLNTGEASQS